MERLDLQEYIYKEIPIVKKNAFIVEQVGEGPYHRVRARLKDHVNHRNTAFGGSLSTALILCSWASVHGILESRGIGDGSVVIQTQRVEYRKPVNADFTAEITPLGDEEINRFIVMLEKFGKSRLTIEARVTQEGDPANRASFEGIFVVVRE
jgi:thioesterase domain-containing protein